MTVTLFTPASTNCIENLNKPVLKKETDTGTLAPDEPTAVATNDATSCAEPAAVLGAENPYTLQLKVTPALVAAGQERVDADTRSAPGTTDTVEDVPKGTEARLKLTDKLDEEVETAMMKMKVPTLFDTLSCVLPTVVVATNTLDPRFDDGLLYISRTLTVHVKMPPRAIVEGQLKVEVDGFATVGPNRSGLEATLATPV